VAWVALSNETALNAEPSNAAARSALIKTLAREAGFDRCGIAVAGPIPRADYLQSWLASGHAATMSYLHRHLPSRLDVRAWLTWARSVIVVALNYHQAAPQRPDDSPRGRVAMYAWGQDYHDLLKAKLARLVTMMREGLGEKIEAKVCADTSAITERELAVMAGVGWIGKNTLVMNQEMGSYFFLGEIVTDLELSPDPPQSDHCGSCTRCLDACPTQAFPEPYAMDARRCISYLTIEHRGPIEPTLTAKMDDWVFGCDVCQQVCPFNREVGQSSEPLITCTSENDAWPKLDEIDKWGGRHYRAHVSGKALSRATKATLQRNARIARSNLEKK
jgi:epoxyqueuosine reductase